MLVWPTKWINNIVGSIGRFVMIVYRQFQDFLLDGLFVLRTDVKIIQIYEIIVANVHSGPMVK